jgi:hypothetical protein
MINVEREKGFEPSTSTLAKWLSESSTAGNVGGDAFERGARYGQFCPALLTEGSDKGCEDRNHDHAVQLALAVTGGPS